MHTTAELNGTSYASDQFPSHSSRAHLNSQKTCGPDTVLANKLGIMQHNLRNSLQVCGPGTFTTIQRKKVSIKARLARKQLIAFFTGGIDTLDSVV